MEESMSSDSESSFVGLVYQQRNTALAASFLFCPPYCENDCGTKVTSEVDITWYFGRAIRNKTAVRNKRASIPAP